MSFKSFDQCVLFDSYYMSIPLANQAMPFDIPFTKSGNATNGVLPTLLDKNIQYIKLTSININSTAATTLSGPIILQCDELCSSDKVLFQFCLIGNTAATEAYNYNMDHIHRVVTPFASQMNMHLKSINAGNITGNIAFGFNVYK